MRKSLVHWKKVSAQNSNLQLVTLFIFLGTTIWAVLSSFALGLSDQEAYYWTWSRHMDWSYFEHPPLQAWITRLLTSGLGNDPWVIRLPASLIGRIIGFYYLYLWIKDRYSKSVALFSIQFYCFSLFILAGSLITLPDAYLFPAFCALLYYSHKRQVYTTALALGLAGLAKWTAILFVPGVVFSFYNRENWRRFLKEILIIGSISLLMQLPVIWWNSQNDWASIKFHLHDRHPAFSWSPQTVTLNGLKFIGGQVGLAGLSILILAFFFFKKDYRKKSAVLHKNASKFHLVAWIMPVFLIVGYSALRGELRFYWTAPAFLLIIPSLINQLDLKKCASHLGIMSTIGAVTSVAILSMVLYLPVGEYLRPLIESYRTYDIRFSPRGDFEGWRQVAAHIKRKNLIRDPDFLVGGSDFRLSSQVAWAFNVSDVRRVLVGSSVKNQFGFWASKLPQLQKRRQAFFFADNRYRRRRYFNTFCRHPLNWNKFNYVMGPYTVKTIKWSECHDLL